MWYNKDYLKGRTCEVIAIHKRDGLYFVLHPMTKKEGYWIFFTDCKVIEYRPQAPTWDAFLKCNKYGYSK
jgi:hypothetical protein